MKSAETKTTSTAQHFSTSEGRQQPFFQREESGSALDNGHPSFFSPNGSVGLQLRPFFGKPTVQTKLSIGQPGDKYEQEADSIADQVGQRLAENNRGANAPTTAVQPAIHRKPIFESEFVPGPTAQLFTSNPSIQPKCAECEQEERLQEMDENEEEPLQMKGQAGDSGKPAADQLETTLHATKGGGAPLPDSTRSSMENAFGADFSNVRVHANSSAGQMNKNLGAQAFTHGSDIYFNTGKYNPDNTDGQKLLAHELTHTVQQGGAGKSGTAQTRIQRWPDWVSDAADWVSDTASDVAGSVVEGAEWVGGQVEDGARWVGGKVAAGPEWVGEQISAAAQWIIDQIRSAIDSGKNYLKEKWESIKEFGRTCFDDIKNGFGTLIHFVTTPLSSFMSALSEMNADLLGSVWNLVKTGSNALWSGISSVINGVLQIGEGIWNTVSGFINGIFDTIAGLLDNSAFDLLPDWIKEEARSIFNDLRSLWNQVSSFWTDLWQRLTNTVREILAAVRSFADNVISYGIEKVISMVRGLKEVYDYVTKFFADPRATIQPFLDQIAGKLDAEAPGRANSLGTELAQANYPGGSVQTASAGTIQRDALDSDDRTTATLDEVAEGILYYIAQAWAELDVRQMLWETVVNMFWPPATIEAICRQFSQLWNDDWATTVDSLYAPTNFWDHPIDCLHDIWSNFLILLDFPLALWRTLNNVVALLMGYVTIIVVLAEAVGAAVAAGAASGGAAAIPAFFAGAAAGLATMAPIGEALMASYVAAESSTVIVILVRLFTAKQVCEKRQVDILTSVASFIAMAVALVLQALMALLAELVTLIANFIKGVPKSAPIPEPIPQPQPQPAPPQPQPQPAPAPPQPAPAPPQPAPPRPRPRPRPQPQPQPAAAGGGQVIPFPSRPAPVTPSVPGQIAAKFETEVSHDSDTLLGDSKPLAELTNGSDANRKSHSDIETMPLSGVPASANGTLQTSRKDRIDPDACKEEKCELPYKWVRNNPTVPGNEVLRYCKKQNNFQKDRHHGWPMYLGGPKDQGGLTGLLQVVHNLHMEEFHGDTGSVGPNGTIHAYIEAFLRNSRDYKNLLGEHHLERRTGSTGNQILITRMRIGGGNDATLRSRVKNKMMEYYGTYSALSKPQMPASAYSVGLNVAENNIR